MVDETNIKYPVVNLFGIPVLAVSMPQVMQMVHQSILDKTRLDIGVINAAKVVNMNRNPELKTAVLSSDVIFADGAAVVWASRLLRTALPERIAGIDLMWEMYKQGDKEKYRIFCFGATEEVNEKVATIIRNEFPNVNLVGRRNGYYKDEDEEAIAQQIADTQANILLVAMTSPKKEKFMEKWGDKMGVHVIHGVGGSFDVMSGKVKRAPALWQKMGMEWLYRVLQEPRRLWKRYFITNSLFLMLLGRTMLKQIFVRK